MSFIKVQGREFIIDAEHNQQTKTIVRNGKDCVVLGSTRVVIRDQDNQMVGAGVSFCSSRDQFTKKHGFKTALKRALEDAKLDKESRTKVWNAFGRTGNRKVTKV